MWWGTSVKKEVVLTLRFDWFLASYWCICVRVSQDQNTKETCKYQIYNVPNSFEHLLPPEVCASKPPSNHEAMAKQRPPSPEDFLPELPLLALLFFAMAAAPNWLHDSWQQFCSGCLFGCFLSEQFNGVLWVVQNSWVKHGQHSHTCQDSVVNLDGHTGPHAAWYCW